MKKLVFFVAAVFFAGTAFFASALEVDRAELQSASANSVVFINYTGPHQIINTVEQIRSIGSGLGGSISANSARESRAGQASRYYVIHAVDPSTTEKLDADILILGEQAIVDHIDNLRRIIAAYLESAYGYSRQDSQTLAVFVTVYNAVYRGNLDAFKQKYKTVVTKNLTADKAGLALNYAEWPGKTQIVIPLSDVRSGGLSTVDTSVISDTKVIESMKKEPDKNIDQRKSMVTIKEKEAERSQAKAEQLQKQATEAKKEATEAKKEATEAKKQATEAKKVVTVEKQKLEETKKEAETAKQKAAENPKDAEAQKKAAETKKEAAKQQEKVAEAEKKAAETEKKAGEAEQKAAETEKKADTLIKKAEAEQIIADKKQSEAQKERIEIAKDQQQLIRESAGLDSVINAAYGLKITDEKEQLSTMVLVDKKTGRTVKESPVTVIRNRVVYPAGKEYIAVAGKTGGNAAVRLVKLDEKNMEIVAQSDEILAANSVLVKDGAFYYVVIQDGKNYVAAKYDGNLKQVLKSNVAVMPATPITVTADGVMVTDTYGFAKLLKADDLQGIE